MLEPVITTEVKHVVPYVVAGRMVAFPTGTSYGLAVDALQGWALQRLRNRKGRPNEKTFTIFLAEKHWDTYLALTLAERQLLQRAAGQPLTLLVSPTHPLTHLAHDGRVGVRVIDHPLMAALAEAVEVPLTATSANRSGESPCFTPAAVREQFPSQLDEATYELSLAAILDGGELPSRGPSTIVRLAASGELEVVREGMLSLSAVRALQS